MDSMNRWALTDGQEDAATVTPQIDGSIQSMKTYKARFNLDPLTSVEYPVQQYIIFKIWK